MNSDPRTLTGIVYTERDARLLSLDLYLPPLTTAATERVPVLIYLHGGAWIGGSRAETPSRLQSLSRAGVAVLSIDYTVVQDAPFPTQLQNILDAAAWLVEHAEQYGLDPSRTVLGGASAGGHLALLSGLSITDSSVTTPELPTGFTIAGMLSMFASLDLTSAKPVVDKARGLEVPAMIANAPVPAFFGGVHPSPAQRAALLAGVPESELTDELLAQFSPLYRLHPAAPPVLLLHGTADAMVSAEHSIRFSEAARAAGVQAGLDLVDGANHEGPEFEAPNAIARMAAFILNPDAEVSHA